ncbi:MAG: fumarylacetoacetate hydrolase family protein [Longimicrobiales bacterium]|nr:fumarylacetoacetate hydrolase family protein [Longimicrobiales bacterium]
MTVSIRLRRRATCLLAAVALVASAAACGDAVATQQVDRIVRYEHQGTTTWGVLEGEAVRALPGATLFEAAAAQPSGASIPLADVALLPPVDPDQTSKVIGVAVNTRRPGLTEPRANPRWFTKFPTSLSASGGGVELPPEATNLNYEGELALIIGREGRHIPEAEAMDYIFGVTVGNDFSENTWYGERNGDADPTRMISKGTDTWAALGPAIVRNIDWSDLRLTTTLNGEIVQDGRTSDLVNSPANLISHVSRYITLKPGDVIYTGTVLFGEGVRRRMEVGDELVVEIEGIGALHSTIVPMASDPPGGAAGAGGAAGDNGPGMP